MGRIAVAAVLVAVACGCLIWLALPWAFEQGASLALASLVPESDGIRMSLSDVRVWALATGKLGDVSVEVRQVDAGKIIFDRMVTTFTGVYMSIAGSAQERLVVRHDSKVRVVIDISEQDLAEFLRVAGNVDNPQVTIQRDGCVIKAEVDLGRESVQVEAWGQFVAIDRRYVGFMIEEMQLDGMELGSEITAWLVRILGGSEPWFDMSLLPVPLTVEDISADNGIVRITASGQDEQR